MWNHELQQFDKNQLLIAYFGFLLFGILLAENVLPISGRLFQFAFAFSKLKWGVFFFLIVRLIQTQISDCVLGRVGS